MTECEAPCRPRVAFSEPRTTRDTLRAKTGKFGRVQRMHAGSPNRTVCHPVGAFLPRPIWLQEKGGWLLPATPPIYSGRQRRPHEGVLRFSISLVVVHLKSVFQGIRYTSARIVEDIAAF